MIKGKAPRKIQQTPITNIGEGMLGIVSFANEINTLKASLVNDVAEKIEEVDTIVTEAVEGLKKATRGIEDLQEETLDLIADIKQGEPGKDADEDKIIQEVLARIPKIDTEEIIKQAVSRLPTIDEKRLKNDILSLVPRKSELKVIQERIEVDPMSVIDKIMDLPEEYRNKLKMKVENIDGLSQTISAMQSQLGRGYLHGGGASLLSQLNDVSITSVTDGDSLVYDGTLGKWINGSGGGGGWELTGNAGLDASVNFLGTTDDVDLVFKRNGYEMFRSVNLFGDPTLKNITATGGLFLNVPTSGNLTAFIEDGNFNLNVQPGGFLNLAGGSGSAGRAAYGLYDGNFNQMWLRAPVALSPGAALYYDFPSAPPSEGAYLTASAPSGSAITMSWTGGPLIGSKNFWPSSSNATYDESYDTKTSDASTATGALNQVKWGLSVGTATDAHWGISGPSAGTHLSGFPFFQQEFTGYAEFKPNTSDEKDLQMFWGATARSVTTWLTGARTAFGLGSLLSDSAIFYVEWDTDGYYLKAVTLDGAGNTTMTTIEKLNETTNPTRLWLRISANSSNVRFFVNKVRVATHTTNIPNEYSGFAPWSYLSYGVTAGGENCSGAVVAAGAMTHQVFGR